MRILTVAVILFGFTISQMVRGRISVLLRIFCFVTLPGLVILSIPISISIGDILKVIGNVLLVGLVVGLESVQTGFAKAFGGLFFSDAYDGTIWIVIVLIIGGIIFLRRKF